MPTLESTISRQRGFIGKREAILLSYLATNYGKIKRILPITQSQKEATEIEALARKVEEAIDDLNRRFLKTLRSESRLMIVTAIEHVVKLDKVLETGQLTTRGISKNPTQTEDLFDATRDWIHQEVSKALTQSPFISLTRINKIVDESFVRTAAIGRNELYGSYRDTQIEIYENNSQDFDGWVWVSQLANNTCPICWEQHGSIHSLNEGFYSHISCRCTTIPHGPDSEILTSGEKLFSELSDEEQRRILGKGKYELYKKGEISLRDLTTTGEHPTYGPFRRERTLAELGSDVGAREVLSPPTERIVTHIDQVTPDKEIVTNRTARQIEDAIREKEVRIRNDGSKTGLIFDKNGNLIEVQPGDLLSVQLSDKQIVAMEDSIFSHNHPNDTTLSISDVALATHADVAEIRAVTPDGHIYILERPDYPGWPTGLRHYYFEADKEIRTKYDPLWDKLAQEPLTAAHYDREHDLLVKMSKEIIESFTDKAGIEYREETIAR